jgi:hypothetical protein
MKGQKAIPALLILFVLLSLLFQVTSVSAALMTCRGDPIFTLSNGTVLTVLVEAETAADNIDKITYTLHVPAGVEVESVVYSPPLGNKEKYKVIQDSQPGSYTTETLVKTKNASNVNIWVTASLDSGASGSAAGYEGQEITINLQAP